MAQHARTVARALGANEDLTEAIALAHDLGHAPFGHAGEETLNKLMAEFGGFEHNIQSLRIVDSLEKRYPNFDGLNLTFETRKGSPAIQLVMTTLRLCRNFWLPPNLELRLKL